MVRGFIFIIIALMLDGLQMAVAAGLTGVTSVTGGLLQLIPILGTIAGAATTSPASWIRTP